MRKFLLVFIVCAFPLSLAQAQLNNVVCNKPGGASKVACTLAYLYGPNGLTLPIAGHNAHFDSDFQSSFEALNTTIGESLTRLPLTSPASGFAFSIDRATGLEIRSTQSLGSILTERGETIGRHKGFVAISYQFFQFSTIDGIGTRNLHDVFTHVQSGGPDPPVFERDVITTTNRLDIKEHQLTILGTFGLTRKTDLSVAVPILDVRMGASSAAVIQNISGVNIHHFCTNYSASNQCLTAQYSNNRSANGIGDVVFRLKGTVFNGESGKVALGADFRAPTGDELQFLGSGAFGLRPFAAFSYNYRRFTPHLNGGFQVNGSSILSGNFVTGKSGHMPNQITYAAGTDVGLGSHFTMVFDLIGGLVINASSIAQTTFTAQDGTSKFSTTAQYARSYAVNDFSLGAKASVGNFMFSANGLFKLNDPGLRATVVPLVGVSYTF